ncbi:MAG TPA: hypothetical protein VLL75_09195 [Vicinamibacteria bacterium]|jgi:hypothetical protein|nr:hypothetical protein [Vicinamibacteria bacterium]
MATSRATARSWIEGFEAAREMERAARRTGDFAHAASIALQLSDAALGARAPEMRARRDAEDGRVRETWRRLKRRHAW